ncbi:MAG TPA: TetR/AcrR family transcriptional regulator [Acidimicrobiales bacterium]|nr:TetR/AcrR family transcriptional regulator [Acidimicrobiales bacterium]
MTPIAPPLVDGRTARAERTRDAVVDALLALIAEGDLRPTGARIAERAGVSLRSVFQHFDDLEALLAAAVTRQTSRITELMEPLPREGPLSNRVRALVDQRAEVYEFITPTRRAAMLQEPFSPTLSSGRELLARSSAAQIADVFRNELARLDAGERREVAAALAAATAWELWEQLRSRQHLAIPTAKRVMGRTVTALLSGKDT